MFDPDFNFNKLVLNRDWSIHDRQQLDTFFGSVFDPQVMLDHLEELAESDCPNVVFSAQFARLLQRNSEPFLGLEFESFVARQQWAEAFEGDVHLRMLEILSLRRYDDDLIPAWRASNGFQTPVGVTGVITSLQTLARFFDVNWSFLGNELKRCLSGSMYEAELNQLRRAEIQILKTYPWHSAFADTWELLVGDETVFYDQVGQEALEALREISGVPQTFLRHLKVAR